MFRVLCASCGQHWSFTSSLSLRVWGHGFITHKKCFFIEIKTTGRRSPAINKYVPLTASRFWNIFSSRSDETFTPIFFQGSVLVCRKYKVERDHEAWEITKQVKRSWSQTHPGDSPTKIRMVYDETCWVTEHGSEILVMLNKGP